MLIRWTDKWVDGQPLCFRVARAEYPMAQPNQRVLGLGETPVTESRVPKEWYMYQQQRKNAFRWFTETSSIFLVTHLE